MKKIIIHIDNEYYIEADELNWILFYKHPITEKGKAMLARRGIESTNEEATDNLGYYGGLRECVTAYVKHKQLDDSEYDTLKMYCDHIDKSNKDTISKITKLLEAEN